MIKSLPVILLVIVLAVLGWSAIGPKDHLTWWLEVTPAIVGLVVIAATHRRFRLTDLTLLLIALHMIILIVGGHYTYAEVPLGFWMRDAFGFARNHYDRIGHFAQGFVPAIIARELLIRLKVVAKPGWLPFLIVSICMAISATYELVEWTAAVISAEAADAFLGTQGDVFDTQKDMAFAGLGAIYALLTLSRFHDAQMRRLTR